MRITLTVFIAALALTACGGPQDEDPTAKAEDNAKPASVESASVSKALDFGDDNGNWPNDGMCDDPRFEGPKAGDGQIDEDIGHDATDCKAAFEAGLVTRTYDPAVMAVDDIYFGNDSTPFKNDGICNDPRFAGEKTDPQNTVGASKMDKTDCRALFEAGEIWLR